MNKFSWYDAQSVKDAVEQGNSTVGMELHRPTGKAAIYKSGGIDILDMVKEGLIQPATIVNVLNIPDLNKITYDSSGIEIGANVTLAEIEADETILTNYLALHEAVSHAATPQLRNMSTIAGNIAQRTRCWYFRSIDHECFRKGGDRCFARNYKSGQNENHAILDNNTCVSVHASSISTALLAYDGSVVITTSQMESKEIRFSEFFVSPSQDSSRETILEDGDLITSIKLPKSANGVKSFYSKKVQRESHDWSIGDVAIVAEMDGKRCKTISIALGSAAPYPIRMTNAEQLVAGNSITPKLASEAAKLAMQNARPLTMNNYKVPLFEATIEEGLLNLV